MFDLEEQKEFILPEDVKRFLKFVDGLSEIGLTMETIIDGRVWMIKDRSHKYACRLVYLDEKLADKRFNIVPC